jgi:hypothetical protein
MQLKDIHIKTMKILPFQLYKATSPLAVVTKKKNGFRLAVFLKDEWNGSIFEID